MWCPFDTKSTVAFIPSCGGHHKSSVLSPQPSAFMCENQDFYVLERGFPGHRIFSTKIGIPLSQPVSWSPFHCFSAGSFFLFFLSKLYNHHGAWTHDPETKICMLYWLSQPGAPTLPLFQPEKLCKILLKIWNLEGTPSEIIYQTLLSVLERMELMRNYTDENVLEFERMLPV